MGNGAPAALFAGFAIDPSAALMMIWPGWAVTGRRFPVGSDATTPFNAIGTVRLLALLETRN